MQIVVAPDKFRGSMSAAQAAHAMSLGVRDALPDTEVVELPAADGGEGTIDALLRACGGKRIAVTVSDPIGRPVIGSYVLLGDGSTAIVEIASASGLALLADSERRPLVTSTRGTGELILSALDHAPRTLIVALGGSATVDGGAGMLRALGAITTDHDGAPLLEGGGALARIECIDLRGIDARLSAVKLVAACDVESALTGPDGASARFGPQKGATAEDIAALDTALHRWCGALESATGAPHGSLRQRPRGGAAGGTAVALAALGAELVSGAALVLDMIGFDAAVVGAALVLTGEGRVDRSSAEGKVVGEVARRVAARVPVLAFCGATGEGADDLRSLGVAALHRIGDGSTDPAALARAAAELRASVARAACHHHRSAM